MTDEYFLRRLYELAPSDDEVEQNYGSRERFESANGGLESLELSLPPELSALSDADLQALVSQNGHQLVLEFEVAGQKGYESKFKSPCWPAGESGITIGVGYDLGYNTEAQVTNSWRAHVLASDLQRLLSTVGLKGRAAKDRLADVKDIVLPFDAAVSVYRDTTVPSFARQTLAAFPGAQELHPDAFSALFSLVYNRGPSMSGSRRSEMRNIREAIAAHRFQAVPHEIRAMKRLWGPELSGLWKRRDAEALLFEQGLIQADRDVVASVNGQTAAGTNGAHPGTSLESMFQYEGDWANEPPDETEDAPVLERNDWLLEGTQPGWLSVSWPTKDDDSPDYRHLEADDRKLKDCSFEFTAKDLELLIRANQFEPERTRQRILFGLRGALLDFSASSPDDKFRQIDRAALRLKEARPDHADFRCVIGVYNLETGRLSGFAASTVVKRDALYNFAKASGTPCNLLPTGCYSYVVGPHRGKPGCLRENEPFAVLRNRNNLAFDVLDEWDHKSDPSNWPFDNIHPAFAESSAAKFSSLGCQVIRGSYNAGSKAYTGEFAMFRTALGLAPPGTDNGKTYSYVLLTGLDAAIAARLRDTGRDSDFATVQRSLARLRHGSRGASVGVLQRAFGLPENNVLDASTKKALADHQKSKLGWADGVYAPAMDAALGLEVFAPQPMVVSSLSGTRSFESASSMPTLESLYLDLGRRVRAAERQPEALGAAYLPQYETATPESLADLIDFGKRAFARVEISVQALLCGDAAADNEQRQVLQQALGEAANWGPDKLVDVLSSLLGSYLFLIPPINRIAAQILVERVLKPTFDEAHRTIAPTLNQACSLWARDLQRRHVTNEPTPSTNLTTAT